MNLLPLPDHVRKYLNEERFLSDDILTKMEVGYIEQRGLPWIVFPVKDSSGPAECWKLKGMPGAQIKAKNWPQGTKIMPYGAYLIKDMPGPRVWICEGEPDCLLLLQAGIPAMTSTGGAGAFKKNWLDFIPKGKEVVLCFDNDAAGKNGREKLREMIRKERKDLQISHVNFDGSAEGYDITDLWKECVQKGDNPQSVLESLVDPEPKEKDEDGIQKEDVPDPENYQRAIAPVEEPETPVTLEEWRRVIKHNFPELVQSAEVCLSVVAQLLIHQVRNPFALVLVDSAASGKTITLNFFDGIPELTYSSDNFTPASLVSQAAHKKAKDLASIDMLPRIRFKTLLVREMATIFSEKEDDLRNKLGILTRVLDGEGYAVDSGVHGQRGYQGDYLFMFLGASTPLPIRVWKVMGDFGHRLFFLSLNTKKQNVQDGVNQLEDVDYKKREYICKKITKAFFYTLWNQHKEGVFWEKDKDDRSVYLWLSRLAHFLAQYRGGIKIYDSEKEKGDQFSYTVPEFEKPRRILQQLYNLTMGHAVIAGRKYMLMEDLMPAVRTTFDSSQAPRPLLLKRLMQQGGKINSLQLSQEMQSMEITAKKEMKKFIVLKLCQEIANVPGAPVTLQNEMAFEDNSTITMKVHPDFDWLLSDEFQGMLKEYGLAL